VTRYRHDPDGLRLPIKIDATTNGEFIPRALSKREVQTIDLAQHEATENARQRGLGRRNYMISSCGSATTLLAINAANGAMNHPVGYYGLPAEAVVDVGVADSVLGGHEFVFDVQNHAINPYGKWRYRSNGERMIELLARSTNAGLQFAHEPIAGEIDYLNLLDGEHYVKDVFLDSDTQMAVMSVLSTDHHNEPLPIADASGIRATVDQLGAGRRLLLHGKVLPNVPGDVDQMESLKNTWGVSAWKLYTQLASGGSRGFRLDDEDLMTPFIEKSRRLGVDVVCAHKGLAFGAGEYAYSTCNDVGGAARLYPDMKFLIYHGGYDINVVEGPYDAKKASAGINALVKSLEDNGVRPNSNVYAELGATWRKLIPFPDQAAHAWGKLLKYVGEDNVLWGTDCIWYGSPQDQIQAFRAFQISEEARAAYGYPELTRVLKEKIFGLNAARVYGVDVPAARVDIGNDRLSAEKQAYLAKPDPSFLTYGPKTAPDFLNLRKLDDQ
jgi:predicted TIM-barrel fold metal-dependent hydrolase